jgi:hypothetical protein
MNRSVRTLTTTALTLAISLAAGAGLAAAQEMEHGRTRPTASREVQSNVITTRDAVLQGYANNVRG